MSDYDYDDDDAADSDERLDPHLEAFYNCAAKRLKAFERRTDAALVTLRDAMVKEVRQQVRTMKTTLVKQLREEMRAELHRAANPDDVVVDLQEIRRRAS